MAKNNEEQPDFSFLKKVNDTSDEWRKSTNRKPGSVKYRWPHAIEKPMASEPPRPMPRVPRGNESEQSLYDTKMGTTGKSSSGVGAGKKTTVPTQVETTQGISWQQTSSEVQQPLQRSSKQNRWSLFGQEEMTRSNTLPRTSSRTPKPRAFSDVFIPPADAQLNTTQPYSDGNHSTTEPLVHTSTYLQPLNSSYVEIHSRAYQPIPPTQHQRKTVASPQAETVQSSNHPQISSQVQEIPHQAQASIPDAITSPALSTPAKAQPSITWPLISPTIQPPGRTTPTHVEYSSSHSEKHSRANHPIPPTQHQRKTVASPQAETVQSSNHTQISSQVQEMPHQAQASISDAITSPALTKAQPSITRPLISPTIQPPGRMTPTHVEYSSSHSENLARFFTEMTALITGLENLRKEKADLLGESAKLEDRYQQLLKELENAQNAQNQVEQLSRRLAEKGALLQTTQAEQLQLMQQTHEKDESIRNLQRQVDSLTQLSRQLAEKDTLLQTAQAERLQLMQQTQQKDQLIRNLQSQVDSLTQQVQTQRSASKLQSQQSPQSEFWEVARDEICLNMHKFLGTGAWGYVVEGTFRGQPVAVKCLHELIRSPEYIEMIRKEIGMMAQIRHPNLVLLIAAVIDAENDPLIVTELLDISLRKAYEKHLLQHPCKLNIFRDIASALNYLHLHHRGEIIHRDVSSANVLLEAKPNNQWRAKLSDFGSAKLAIEAKTTGPGAPVYAAPEVRRETGIRQTAKLDVYSYGILLCEVILGQFPIEEKLLSMMQVIQSQWAFMHGLIVSCVQVHPDKRPAMSFVLSELDKVRL